VPAEGPESGDDGTEQLITARNLRVWFDVRIGLIAGLVGKEVKHVRAVDGISFDVKRGEVFCLVGESGCGKTTTGKALLRLNKPTDGNMFFDVPEREWSRLLDQEKRIADLEPIVARTSPADRKKAMRDWARIRKMAARIESIRNPAGATKRQGRRQRIEKTIEVLDVRERALRDGRDPTVQRLAGRERALADIIEDLGSWFTPRRARRLERFEAQLKEAKYRKIRAESTDIGVRRSGRAVRRLERKVARTRSHIQTGDPKAQTLVDALRRAGDEKGRKLTQLELSQVAADRDAHRRRLASLKESQSSTIHSQIAQLETAIAEMRKRGGPALEILEYRAKVGEFRDRYDLVTWGKKGKPTTGGRRKRRKEVKLRMRELRRRMQIIYQDPYESLNPKLSIFDIVSEPLIANRVVSTPPEAEAAVAKALEDVGLRPATEYMFRYPHELSGGQRQRVGIATALVVDPEFIVADEPVSMLDASVRTEILALLLELKKSRDLTYLFITHDLGLAWILADRIAVMYLGKIVETGDGAEIIQHPRHPYTKALISVVPSPNPAVRREKMILRGERPNPVDIPPGCRFHPRCPMAVGICGWNSDEVQAELSKLLTEDRDGFPEARTVDGVTVTGAFELAVATSDPAGVEKYLWKRLQSVALGRPALGSIRKAAAKAGTLELTLHKPVEPPLRRITEEVSVACHLVEPEIVEPATVVAA